jgi:iron(III) transport system permease protein
VTSVVLQRPQQAPSISTGRWGRRLSAAAVGALLVYLVVVPLVLLAISSVRPTGFPLEAGFTLDNFRKVYGAENFLPLVRTTAIFAISSTALALAFGIGLAWLVERTDMPGRNLFRLLVILPMATPPVLLAIGWAMLLSPRTGFFNLVLRDTFGFEVAPFNVYSLPGMVFVEALALVPTAFLFLAPAFRNMDPNLEEAALASGASAWTMIRRVLLPLLWPSIAACGVFLLIVCFVVFDIPGTLGMPARIYVLSTQIYYLTADSPAGIPLYGQVSALGTFFLMILFGLGYLYYRFTRESQKYRTISGKGFRPRLVALGGWRWVATGGVTLYFFLAVLAPLAILVWASLMPFQTRPNVASLSLVTFDNHLDFFRNTRLIAAATNSMTVAFVSATVVAALSLVISWLVVRQRVPGARFIDNLAFAPIAIPGVMLGVAVVYVYLTLDFIFPVYGTIWILVIAYVTHYVSFGSRLANGVMVQIHPELEEAARASGAGNARVLRRITAPLVWPAVAAIWIWVLAHAMRELSTALMLSGRNNTVMPTLLWDYWTGGEPTRAATVGVWLVVALAVFLGSWHVLASRGGVQRAV